MKHKNVVDKFYLFQQLVEQRNPELAREMGKVAEFYETHDYNLSITIKQLQSVVKVSDASIGYALRIMSGADVPEIVTQVPQPNDYDPTIHQKIYRQGSQWEDTLDNAIKLRENKNQG